MDASSSALIEALKKEDDTLDEKLEAYRAMLTDVPVLPPDTKGQRKEVCKLLLEKLHLSQDAAFINAAVDVLRYLSRDKSVVLTQMANSSALNLLRSYANLDMLKPEHFFEKFNEKIELNATKVLCNLIFLTQDSNRLCSDSGFIQAILRQLQNWKNRSHDQNVLSLRLIFLVSALNHQGRRKLATDFDARKVVLEHLSNLLQPSQDSRTVKTRSTLVLSVDVTNLCKEILKVLFNLNMDLRRSSVHNQQELEELDTTIELCVTILMSKCVDTSLTESLHCNAGNAIYSVPPRCFNLDKLIGPSPPNVATNSEQNASNFRNMKPVTTLLNILRHRVLNDNLANDVLHPLLALLSQLCRLSRDIRIHIKQEILPPRKDFKHRPEEGADLRHKLIKLFTHNNTDLKHGAADFLFVLCKEKVDRFVKYTGYGNAAGLLAMRGLLAGGQGDTQYSDTDSDSDTEEYKDAKDELNPVTGHVPPPQRNPMEGMTDEQKEYLAVQLANELSKLSSNSVIQPVCVGDDGKLVPIQQKVHETKLEEPHSSSDDES